MGKKFFHRSGKSGQVAKSCMLLLGLSCFSTASVSGEEHTFSDRNSAPAALREGPSGLTPATIAPAANNPAGAIPAINSQPIQTPGLQVRSQLEQELQPGEKLIAPGLPAAPTPPEPAIIAGNGVIDGGFMDQSTIVNDPNVIQGHHPHLGGGLLHHHGNHGVQNGCKDLCQIDCRMGWYGTAEAMWMMRENEDNFSLSRQYRLGGFDYDEGTRFTLGRKTSCSEGWEVGYVGPFEWVTAGSSNVTIAPNASALFTSGGIASSTLDPFNDSQFHSQYYRSEIQSVELNRRLWAWDVFSFIYGVRVIDFEEDLEFRGIGNNGVSGLLSQQMDNQLVGFQVGGDWMYPLSQRLLIGQRGRLAGFGNFYDGSVLVTNGNSVVAGGSADDQRFAGMIEYGVRSSYRIYRNLYATAGYEFWYIYGVGLASDQPITNVNPAMGTNFYADDDVFLHGGSVGLELWF
jgi:hypothetical protein